MKTFVAAKTKVAGDKQAEKLILAFRQRQFELQNHQLQGKAPSEAQLKSLEHSLAELGKLPVLKDYMQAEQRLGQVLAELNRSLLDACSIETVPDTVGRRQT